MVAERLLGKVILAALGYNTSIGIVSLTLLTDSGPIIYISFLYIILYIIYILAYQKAEGGYPWVDFY